MWEKLVFAMVFPGFEQKFKKSDGKTTVSHISQIWTRFNKFEKTWFYLWFLLVLTKQWRKVIVQPRFLTFSDSESNLKTFKTLFFLVFLVFPRFLFTLLAIPWFSLFSYHFLMVWSRNWRKVMVKPRFLTFRRFRPDLLNLRKLSFIYGFCWF